MQYEIFPGALRKMPKRVAEEAVERMMKLQRGDLASACGEVTVVEGAATFGVSGRKRRH